jgi:hypothetical protein
MAPNILRNKRAHPVTSRPSSFGETSIGAGRLARRANRPGCRQGLGCDVGGAERANRRHPRRSTGLDYLGPVGGRQSYLDRQGCDRRVLAQAYRSDDKSRIRHRGEVSVAWCADALSKSHSGGWFLVTSRPTAPPATICGRTHRWRGSAAGPARSARDHAKCSKCPSLRYGWLSSR